MTDKPNKLRIITYLFWFNRLHGSVRKSIEFRSWIASGAKELWWFLLFSKWLNTLDEHRTVIEFYFLLWITLPTNGQNENPSLLNSRTSINRILVNLFSRIVISRLKMLKICISIHVIRFEIHGLKFPLLLHAGRANANTFYRCLVDFERKINSVGSKAVAVSSVVSVVCACLSSSLG